MRECEGPPSGPRLKGRRDVCGDSRADVHARDVRGQETPSSRSGPAGDANGQLRRPDTTPAASAPVQGARRGLRSTVAAAAPISPSASQGARGAYSSKTTPVARALRPIFSPTSDPGRNRQSSTVAGEFKMRGAVTGDRCSRGENSIDGWLSAGKRKAGCPEKGGNASTQPARRPATSTREENQASSKPNGAQIGSSSTPIVTSAKKPGISRAVSLSKSARSTAEPGDQILFSQASSSANEGGSRGKRQAPSGGSLLQFFKPVDVDHSSKRMKLHSVDVERRSPMFPLSSDKSSAGSETFDTSKKFRQSCLTFDQAPRTMKRDTKWITFGEARFGFTFERRVRALDDLDDVIVAGAPSLPDLPRLEDNCSERSLSMKMLAELAVVHDFVRVFSGELSNFSFTDAAGKHLSLDHLEKVVMDYDGFSLKLAELHSSFVNYIYLDQDQEAPIDDPLDFQQFTAAVLEGCDEYAVLRTVEYPYIPPETRVSVLSKLLSLVIESDSFARHLKQLELRRVELRKERLQRKELLQAAESALAEMEERCASLERRIAEIDTNVEQQGAQVNDVENQTGGSDVGTTVTTRTSRQLNLERRRGIEKEKVALNKELVQEARAAAAKLQKIKELKAKEGHYDADKERFASQLRGGDVAHSAIACSGVVKLGFDRWGRIYWHWRSFGGILVEEAPELPERRRPARGADEVAKAHLPPSISLASPPPDDQDGASSICNAPISTYSGPSLPIASAPEPSLCRDDISSRRISSGRSPTKWWYIRDVESFREVLRSLNARGAREKALKTHLEVLRQDIEDSYPKFDLWLRRRGVLPLSTGATVVSLKLHAAEESGETEVADPAQVEIEAGEPSVERGMERMTLEEYLAQQATRVLSMAATLRDIAEEHNMVDFENLCSESTIDSGSLLPPFNPLLPPPLEVLTADLPRLVAEYVRDLVAGIAKLHAGNSKEIENDDTVHNKPSKKGEKPAPAAIVAQWAARPGYFHLRENGDIKESSAQSASSASAPALGVTAVWLNGLLGELETVLDSKALRRVQRREREARRERMRAFAVLKRRDPVGSEDEVGREDAERIGGNKESEKTEGMEGLEVNVRQSRHSGARGSVSQKQEAGHERRDSGEDCASEEHDAPSGSSFCEESGEESSDESEAGDSDDASSGDDGQSDDGDPRRTRITRNARFAAQGLRRSRRVAARFADELGEEREGHEEDEEGRPQNRRPTRAAAVLCGERTRRAAAELARFA